MEDHDLKVLLEFWSLSRGGFYRLILLLNITAGGHAVFALFSTKYIGTRTYLKPHGCCPV